MLQFLRGTRYEVLSCVLSEHIQSVQKHMNTDGGGVIAISSVIPLFPALHGTLPVGLVKISLITQPPPLQGGPTQHMQRIVKHWVRQFS